MKPWRAIVRVFLFILDETQFHALAAYPLNRIVLGNTVIDQEKVRTGSGTIRSVAIYDVERGKIKPVTFIIP